MPTETAGVEKALYQGGSKRSVRAILEEIEQLHSSAKSRISAQTKSHAACDSAAQRIRRDLFHGQFYLGLFIRVVSDAAMGLIGARF